MKYERTFNHEKEERRRMVGTGEIEVHLSSAASAFFFFFPFEVMIPEEIKRQLQNLFSKKRNRLRKYIPSIKLKASSWTRNCVSS